MPSRDRETERPHLHVLVNRPCRRGQCTLSASATHGTATTGFGSRVFHHLRGLGGLPHGVQLFDAGIAGLNALPYFEDCAKAVMVDALSAGGPEGSVHRMVPNDLAPPGGELSLHELGLPGLLAALGTVSSEPPELILIGAQIGPVQPFTIELSAPVLAAVPAAARLVLREVEAGPGAA